MKLFIDASGGIAGDMIIAALISMGANENICIDAMQLAASKIGNAKISYKTNKFNEGQLFIELNKNNDHLPADNAKFYLSEIFKELSIRDKYKNLGDKILQILIEAESQAHKTHHFDMPHHGHGENVHLHEAQDIIMDISACMFALQYLDLPDTAFLIDPVNTGSGKVKFSHGELDVPAPATKIILEKYRIPYYKGSVKTELCTPTAASIMAGLDVRIDTMDAQVYKIGKSRGSKDLPVPPLRLIWTGE